jgi:hypothetical protein
MCVEACSVAASRSLDIIGEIKACCHSKFGTHVSTAPEQYGDHAFPHSGHRNSTATTTLQPINTELQNWLIYSSSGAAAVHSGARYRGVAVSWLSSSNLKRHIG